MHDVAETSPRAGPSVHIELPAGPDAPAHARAAVDRLKGKVGSECAETVELVISELVTNAVRHSGAHRGDPIELEVRCVNRRIRISVTDPGPGFDHDARPPAPGSIGGWGLYLVGEVVDSWAVEKLDGPRTRVVAEVPAGGGGNAPVRREPA